MGELINIRAAGHAVGKRWGWCRIGLDETTHIIAELAVPFPPARAGQRAGLIPASGIPGLCNHLAVSELPISVNRQQGQGDQPRIAIFSSRKGSTPNQSENHPHAYGVRQ